MFQFKPILTKRGGDSSDIIIPPSSHGKKASGAFRLYSYNIPYTNGAREQYAPPIPIGKLKNTREFSLPPKAVTDEKGITIKNAGESHCTLPHKFSQFTEFVQRVLDFEKKNSSKALFQIKEAKLLVYYEDGYDSIPASEFHCDPHYPVKGNLHNLFAAASVAGTEYTTVPNPNRQQIFAMAANEINYIGNGCHHRRPYLWEDISRVFVAMVTTASQKQLSAIDYKPR